MYLFQKTAALWDVGRTVEVTVRTVGDVPFFKHDSFITLFINVKRYQKQLILTAADLAVVNSTDIKNNHARKCDRSVDLFQKSKGKRKSEKLEEECFQVEKIKMTTTTTTMMMMMMRLRMSAFTSIRMIQID
ncbi:hypothetical protein Tsp_02756 [Trichinella spiralis]|uniref:hypothetical protein n=1 Tax=Trichinella spiralis TaxID=6334 RepID=UPI0001EFC37C|nr:hypothetical protein Tsp_02756 [Trichinella spiralis]